MLSCATPSKNTRGFTLIEAAIVLGIVGIVVAGIWAGAGTVINRQKINRAAGQIMTISSNMRSFLNGSSLDPSAGEITQMLITAGMFPADMTVQSTVDFNHGAGNRPTHPWGGYVSSYAATVNSSPKTFRISYYGLTVANCINLAMAVAGNGGSNGPIGFGSWYTAAGSGGNPGNPYGASNYVDLTTTKLTPDLAVTKCGGDPSHGNPAMDGQASAEFDFAFQ